MQRIYKRIENQIGFAILKGKGKYYYSIGPSNGMGAYKSKPYDSKYDAMCDGLAAFNKKLETVEKDRLRKSAYERNKYFRGRGKSVNND